MTKRLMVLVGMLAVMLLVAAPALAQTPGEKVEATGVLQYAGSNGGYDYYTINDEATGKSYTLRSDSVDLGSYLGQRVDVSGRLVVEEIPTSAGEAQSVYVEVGSVKPPGVRTPG